MTGAALFMPFGASSVAATTQSLLDPRQLVAFLRTIVGIFMVILDILGLCSNVVYEEESGNLLIRV